LAHFFNCEILSADSRQFFKELTIGTAKVTPEEMESVSHHFVGHISIEDEYNVGRFENDAIAKLEEIFTTQDIAILAGGSGLYVDSVCKGIDDIPKDAAIRAQLQVELKEKGIEALQEELKKLDPEHYAKMNLLNPQRLMRALEVCRTTGKTYTSFRTNTDKHRPFKVIKIGLKADREIMYDNINKRVHMMMENGLLDEVKSVYPQKGLNALNTVGYKEMFVHLEGTLTLEEAIAQVQQNTRRFAKRQMTWFRRDENTKWFDTSEIDAILPYLKSQMV
jgi:tRNA dimethylallyltransferase